MPIATLLALLPAAEALVMDIATLIQQHNNGTPVTQEQLNDVMERSKGLNVEWAADAPKGAK